MSLVAKGRHVPAEDMARAVSRLDALLEAALANGDVGFSDGDPLRNWFTAETASLLRSFECQIQEQLTECSQYRSVATLHTIGNIPPKAAFFYTVAFRALRRLLRAFVGSNPTWMKTAKTPAQSTTVSPDQLRKLMTEEVSALASALSQQLLPVWDSSKPAQVDVASSTALPLNDMSVSAVITSPPYCTRIDYAMATRAELAFLGYDEKAFRTLRERLIGATVIAGERPRPAREWGETCLKFLRRMEQHTSKASASYYLSTHLQYFSSIFASLREVDRALRGGGYCILVVQDSYYKDLHNDLPSIILDMARGLRWRSIDTHDFQVTRTMARINTKAQRYAPHRSAVESVLVFSKRHGE